jgi:hypothetical protein
MMDGSMPSGQPFSPCTVLRTEYCYMYILSVPAPFSPPQLGASLGYYSGVALAEQAYSGVCGPISHCNYWKQGLATVRSTTSSTQVRPEAIGRA